jgi:hypothetical protein
MVGLALLAVLFVLPAPAAARSAEVYLVVQVDLQRLHPNAPADEPLEPTPAIQDRARELIATHPAFREVSVRLATTETPPNPRVPSDFLRLVDHGVDDVVVVNLSYHLRLDSFAATGRAAIQGFVAVHNVAGRRKVASRELRLVVTYPGDVTKEAVIQAELAARGRGATVPIEEVELGLLDAAAKARLAPELSAALGVYHPASLPALSRPAVQDAMSRMARFLAASPDRRDEAIQMLESYLARYPDSPHRADLERRLRRLRQAPRRDPGRDREREQERAANGVAQSLTAGQLAELFDQVVGRVVEVRAFRLDWRDGGKVVLTPMDRKQDFILEQVPAGVRDLEADPSPIYVLVVERRKDPDIPILDAKVPVVRWIGCPKTACPSSP